MKPLRVLANPQVMRAIPLRPIAAMGVGVIVAASFVACANTPPAPTVPARVESAPKPPEEISPALRASIEARIAGASAVDRSTSEVGAVVVGVIHRDGSSFVSTGLRNASGLPANPDTLFKTCSLTKVLTGVLLADAVLQGTVRLSDEAQTHLPNLTLPRHKEGPIRVEHLATYSSGFPWQPTNFVGKTEGGYSPEAWHSFLEHFELPHAPGNGFQYGNVGYALLGDILAEDAKMPLRALFQKRMFDPLRMNRSGFIGERPDDPNRAQGIDDAGKRVALDRDEPSQPAACALESSASDLTAFLRAHLTDGAPLNAAMKFALKPQRKGVGDYDQMEMGLGWMLGPQANFASKSGAIEGYRSMLGIDLGRRDAVVILAADERVDGQLLMDGIFDDLAHEDEQRVSAPLATVPPSASPMGVQFDNGLRLVGIEAPAEVVLGQDAIVRYFYRVDRTPPNEWRAFVHADAKGERVKSDHVLSPPMRAMSAGAIVEDRVVLHFGVELKNTSFTLFNGFFRSGKRMPFKPNIEDRRVPGPTIRIVSTKDAGGGG